MKITFAAPIKDLVDTQARFYNRTQITGKRRFYRYLYALLLGVVVFYIRDGSLAVRLIWALLCMAVMLAFFSWGYPLYVKRYFRKRIRDAYGKVDKVDTEMEFEEEQISCRMAGAEILLKWAEATEIVSNETDFEIWFDKKMMLVIRRSSFESQSQYDQWLDFASRKTQ